MSKTFASPKMLVCRSWTCDYCSAVATAEVHATDRQFGILTCHIHEPLGKRDVNAYFHRECAVRVSEFCAAFPDAAAVPNIMMDSFILKRRGAWLFPTSQPGIRSVVPVPVTVPNHLLSLNLGFYLRDYLASVPDQKAQQQQEQPKEQQQQRPYTYKYEAPMRAAAAAKAAAAAAEKALSAEDLLKKLTTVVWQSKRSRSRSKSKEQQQEQELEQLPATAAASDDADGEWTTVSSKKN